MLWVSPMPGAIAVPWLGCVIVAVWKLASRASAALSESATELSFSSSVAAMAVVRRFLSVAACFTNWSPMALRVRARRAGSGPLSETSRKLPSRARLVTRFWRSAKAASRGVTSSNSTFRPGVSWLAGGVQVMPSLLPMGEPTVPVSTTRPSCRLSV